jgi:hypothetical protein
MFIKGFLSGAKVEHYVSGALACQNRPCRMILHEMKSAIDERHGPGSKEVGTGVPGSIVLALTVLMAVTLTTGVFRDSQEGHPEAQDLSTPGWHSLPNTKLASVCPQDDSLHGTNGCDAIVSAWGGAAADTKLNRLLIWGGGHNNYYGNEVYALDLMTRKMILLVPPTSRPQACVEVQHDGKPSSRHTYYNLAYLPTTDKMFSFGGALACETGTASYATWTLDMETLEWKQLDQAKGKTRPNGQPGLAVVVYDPSSKLVFIEDLSNLYKYDPATNTYTMLNSVNGVDYHQSGVIDAAHNLLFLVGGGQFWAISIARGSNYALQNWSSRVHGCDPLMKQAYPGLAFDNERNVVVGWAGGDSVYIFDLKTKSCTAQSFHGGPGEQQPNGTNGRFAYFPGLRAFVLVNDWNQDAYLFRLEAGQPH